jgi:putative YphP/YqiW family bacilliredoxin
MYPEQLVAPMRSDLTTAGFTELKTSEEVDKTLKNQTGTTLLVINSVCGCAAGAARPGVKWALQHSDKKPHSLLQFLPE